ncbi:exported hypothetical protein [uncultured Desulfobacterium sp.]|uniref:Uncharacterized protein n=1 Tax=uncultured Desulfobacterium sp. TaxID=201089 RepID=A0A445MSR9_9BACT|nr:exported hypothetical protein [uncultured Desulfobacterium sp.]
MRTYRAYSTYLTLIAFSIIVFSINVSASPVCETVKILDSPLTVEFHIRDAAVGLSLITVTEAINANVYIPPFAPGIISPIVVVASKITSDGDFRVTLESKNISGDTTICHYPVQETGDGPDCEISKINQGPPFSIEFTIQDSDTGLEGIDIIESANAEVFIPDFEPGTTGPVTVVATKIDQAMEIRVQLAATNSAGGISNCDYGEPLEDNDPPTCQIIVKDPGPPSIIEFIIQDVGSGLETISLLENTNVTVSIPNFVTGTKDKVVVQARQLLSHLDFRVVLDSVDLRNNSNITRYPAVNYLRTRPEFDGVGDDSSNYFHDYFKEMVIEKGIDSSNRKINMFSSFASEYFQNTAGMLSSDPCFSTLNHEYMSSLTPSWSETIYEWRITLQMKPAADLLLCVIGCVLRSGENDVWNSARQTGLYRLPWSPNQSIFVPNTNPLITVKALPGAKAGTGFPPGGFYLDARILPGLRPVSVINSLFSLGALFEEGILLSRPVTGFSNASGQTMVELNQGDIIHVTITIPFNNTTDIRFGNDNVLLKYSGVIGTELIADN